MLLVPRKGILDIEPYVPGLSKADAGRILKLSSNENPFGPSPVAVQAYREAADNIHRYPDGGSFSLREALAKKHQIAAERIVCGTGSDELITLLCQAYVGAGDEVLYTEHGFLMYPIAALAAGGKPVKASEPERKTCFQTLLDSITEKTKIIFIANPNNPTGSTVYKDELLAFHRKLPKDILLVIDSAYAEYVGDDAYTDGKDLVDQFDNVVMLRTFSKVYGLGGMRIGWSYSSLEIANVLNRIRGIFNLSIAAQAAALAVLEDKIYVEKSVLNNAEQRAVMTEKIKSLGLTVYPSGGNFLLFSLGSEEKAAACFSFLKDRGILLRAMTAYGLPDCLRMTIGLPDDMVEVFEAIKAFISPDAA